jgi:hypothetical protein
VRRHWRGQILSWHDSARRTRCRNGRYRGLGQLQAADRGDCSCGSNRPIGYPVPTAIGGSQRRLANARRRYRAPVARSRHRGLVLLFETLAYRGFLTSFLKLASNSAWITMWSVPRKRYTPFITYFRVDLQALNGHLPASLAAAKASMFPAS